MFFGSAQRMGREARREALGTASEGILTMGVRVPSTGLGVSEESNHDEEARLTVIEEEETFASRCVLLNEIGLVERRRVLSRLFSLERFEELEDVGRSPDGSSLVGHRLMESLGWYRVSTGAQARKSRTYSVSHRSLSHRHRKTLIDRFGDSLMTHTRQ
jgi:hypothetical protein